MTRRHVWITKYALTSGIQEYLSAEVDGEGNAWIRSVGPTGYSGFSMLVRPMDAHFSLADAMKRAEEMRRKKIASLTKQAKALETKSIKVVQK